MASAHETRETTRYRQLSLRFLPFNTGIHRLLAMLASESEQRLAALWQAAEKLQLSDELPTPEPARTSPETALAQQFFVTNEAMAAATLTQALHDQQQSVLFYRQLREGSGMMDLDRLLAAFTKQALMQCRILQENQGLLGVNMQACRKQHAA
ncbi:hypothetical protein [Halomonas sp. WWR20]